MPAKALAALLGLVLLAGCAGDVAQPGLAPDHPANPDAATASLPPPSETLAVAAREDTSADAATAASHDHAAMQHGASGHDHHANTALAPPTAATKPSAGAAQYVCPHHPEVTSDKPDQRCPKCGMKLVKKETTPNVGTRHEGH